VAVATKVAVTVAMVAAALALGQSPANGDVVVTVATESEYRDAVANASGTEPNVIVLAADITLASDVSPIYTSTQPLEIDGNGHVLDGADNSRLLLIPPESMASLRIDRLIARNGSAPTESGGAIATSGAVLVADSTFESNGSGAGGGAIWAFGAVTITGSTFVDNGVLGGAGLAVYSRSEVSAVNSTFTGNTTLSILGFGTVASDGPVGLYWVTMSANSALVGTNVYTDGDLTSYGTVIDTETGANCQIGGSATSLRFNWSSDASCGLSTPFDVEDGSDPMLGVLADNGGDTPTMLPLAGSPLIDAIPVEFCYPDVATDQRGRPRPADGTGDGTDACDVGAVEVQPTPAPPPPPSPTTTPAPSVGNAAGPAPAAGQATRPRYTG
jgi:hypothetical protein